MIITAMITNEKTTKNQGIHETTNDYPIIIPVSDPLGIIGDP